MHNDSPRVLTTSEARARGLDPSRLRGAEWERPFHGIRARKDATWIELAAARVRAAGRNAMLCGPSAAAMWGVPVPGSASAASVLHVAVPRPHRAPRGPGIIGYSLGLDPIHITVRRGVPVTSPARTWIDSARTLDVPDLVAFGDRLCLPVDDLCSVPELAAALTAAPSVRGVAKLRKALPLVRPGAESFPESVIRVALITAGLPEPRVNADVYDGRRFVARVDLLFAAFGVVVEYEGRHHAEDARQWRRDLTRIGELQRLGYIVERAHADDLRDPAALVARVRTHLVRRGWRP